MPDKPLLSVAVVIHNQRDAVESTLGALYELTAIPFELFLFDDGSTDGSDDAIQSLLDYHGHDHTFFYRHEKPHGRGNTLNEAILQCNSPLFWAPETIGQIDESELANRLNKLSNSTNHALLQQFQLPSSPKEWIEFLDAHRWPADGEFIWHLPFIRSSDSYFNPHLGHHQALELALRLDNFPAQISDAPWFASLSYVKAQQPDFLHRQELLISLLRNSPPGEELRNVILDRVHALKADKASLKSASDAGLLAEAIELKEDGRYSDAMELIETLLDDNASHPKARQLKIEILEKKRRFVEASELKHEADQTKTSKNSTSVDSNVEAEISLIIPTTIYGKPALEHCLLSISEHCDTSALELIVIDNASLDDTHDYLDELREKDFLQCRIIKNRKNKGFAASVNQALDICETPYACILHNDIEFESDAISELHSLMEDNPELAAIGPTTNKTLNPDQAGKNRSADEPELTRIEYLDSFCMMIRTGFELRMDEAYELAFFEDIDFCFQARSEGHKVGIATQVEVKHYFGTTTFPLNLDTESRQYWKNVAHFNKKWDIEVLAEQELKSMSTFDQLLALDELVNPLYPEDVVKAKFEELFTDELKTEIFNTSHDAEILCRLVHLFMVMDERDVMRRLEDRLESVDLPATLIYQLVRFYYQRNIYSRCTHYLNQLKPQNESLRADLYRLSMLVENKNFDEAIPMLRNLMDRTPANPTLCKLAGDIHKLNGNDEEAESFHELARQINPFKFSDKQPSAFGFEE